MFSGAWGGSYCGERKAEICRPVAAQLNRPTIDGSGTHPGGVTMLTTMDDAKSFQPGGMRGVSELMANCWPWKLACSNNVTVHPGGTRTELIMSFPRLATSAS